MTERLLFHGGVSGLRRGSIILPGMAEHRYVEGCPHCEAQRRGETPETALAGGADPPTPPGWVYATTHRLYARYYASRAWRGDLYRVKLLDPERSTEDQFPTWRGPQAEVVKVLDRKIALTMKERRHLFRLWGGTDSEFEAMIWQARREFAPAPS